MSVTEMKFVGAQVPKDLVESFKALAKDNDRPFAAELRQAMRAHVDAHQADDERKEPAA